MRSGSACRMRAAPLEPADLRTGADVLIGDEANHLSSGSGGGDHTASVSA